MIPKGEKKESLCYRAYFTKLYTQGERKSPMLLL